MDRPSDTGVALPQDVVEEILLRFPARQLCGFRAVCRSWCCLLDDPSFVKAHAALHPGLILALATDGNHIDVLGFSGNVVQQIHVPAAEEGSVVPAHPGPLYLFRASSGDRIRVVAPDTSTVSVLPFDDPDEPRWWPWSIWIPAMRADYTIGAVSTGHRKVLRVVTHGIKQFCHVLTLRGSDYNQQSWRRRPSPPIPVKSATDVHDVAVEGVVYFLATNSSVYNTMLDTAVSTVVSFDLEEEEWWPAIPGPSAINTGVHTCRLKLAKLNNTLAMVHYDSDRPNIDLWFTEDLEIGLWVKKHSIHVPYPHKCSYLEDMMELDNGRIVFSYYYVSETMTQQGQQRWTRIYDPTTKACTDVPQLGGRRMIGFYQENMFFLEEELTTGVLL